MQFSTRLHRWFEEERPSLFCLMQYARYKPEAWPGLTPKIGTQALCDSLERLLLREPRRVGHLLATANGGARLYFKKTAYNWLAFSLAPPPCYDEGGKPIEQSQLDSIAILDKDELTPLFLFLNGKLMYLLWFACGDDFHVTKGVVSAAPLPAIDELRVERDKLAQFREDLAQAMQRALSFKLNAGKRVGNYNLAKCRQETDLADREFARLLGLTEVWPEVELLYEQAVKTDFDE